MPAPRGGVTPLHAAALNGNIRLAELLIAKGADVNAKAVGGNTPLHLLASLSWDSFVDNVNDLAALLIAKGANVNVRNEQGLTPLHAAAMSRNPDVAGLLLAKGANVNAKDDNGSTPLDFAKDGDDVEMVRLLIAHGGVEGQP